MCSCATTLFVLRKAIAAHPHLGKRLRYTNAPNVKPLILAVIGITTDHLAERRTLTETI